MQTVAMQQHLGARRAVCGAARLRLRVRTAAAAKAAPRVRAVPTRASADAEESGPLPALVAVGAPVTALAASAAALGAGAIPSQPIVDWLHFSAGFVFDAKDSVPEFVTKYFHGLNMATVLFAMGGYGAYLGWQIRDGKGGEPTFGTSDSAAELHPKLMGGMTLFFLAGGQGGLLFQLLQGKPILESPHAVTALAGLGLLVANGALGAVMQDKAALRTTHAYLGTALMAVFVGHAALGASLALAQ